MHLNSHMHRDLHQGRHQEMLQHGERGRLRAMLRRSAGSAAPGGTYTPAGDPRGDRPAVHAPAGAQHQRRRFAHAPDMAAGGGPRRRRDPPGRRRARRSARTPATRWWWARCRPARATRDAPRVVLYGHYDVQPPGPDELWTSPPFEPTVRDGSLYARGASDDKGNLFMLLAAVQRLAGAGRAAGARGVRGRGGGGERRQLGPRAPRRPTPSPRWPRSSSTAR